MILDTKIQGTVITRCCRVEERKIIVACIYFAWRCNVVKKQKDTGYYVCSKFVGSWVIGCLFFCVRTARKKRQAGIRWKDTRYKQWKAERQDGGR